MIVIAHRKRSQMNTVVFPCMAVLSPCSPVLRCLWQLSWNVPACCFTKTPQLRAAAHSFFAYAIIFSLSPLLPLKDFCLNVSDLGEHVLPVCICEGDSVSHSPGTHCLLWNVCLCAYTCAEWAYGYKSGTACVFFPALLVLLWDVGHIYLGQQRVIAQGDKRSLFG